MRPNFNKQAEKDNTADTKSPLFQAVLKGDLGEAKRLIAAGADIRYMTKDGYTLVHAAISSDRQDVLDFVISLNVNLDRCKKAALPPLLQALRERRPFKMFQALVQGGANLDAKNRLDETVVHFWAKYGRADDLNFLIKNGVDLNTVKKNGWHAMHAAAAGNNIENFQCLAERGAPVFKVMDFNEMPLHTAIRNGSHDVLEYILQNMTQVKERDNFFLRSSDVSPLMLTALKGDVKMAQMLLTAGFDPNEKNKRGLTALHYAIESKNVAVVKFLIANGSDVSKINNAVAYGATLMCLAASLGQDDIIKVLLEEGVSPNTAKVNGDRPLIEAVRKKHLSCAKLLLEAGADVNASDGYHLKPIHHLILSSESKPAMAKLLLDHGAEPHIETESLAGVRSYEIAVKRGITLPIFDVLLNDKKGFRDALLKRKSYLILNAIYAGKLDFIKLVGKSGVDLNFKYKGGMNNFTVAALSNNFEIADWFADIGIDVNCSDDDGETPLTLAISNDNFEQVDFVLKKLAARGIPVKDALPYVENLISLVAKTNNKIFKRFSPHFDRSLINEKGARDETALHVAARSGSTFKVRKLVAMGADIEAINAEGETPLTVAIKNGKTQVAMCLKIMGAAFQKDKNLMCYAAHAKTEGAHIVAWLVKKGISVNRRDEQGNVALHYAVIRKDAFAVEMLLSSGAIFDSKNLKGETPYALALRSGDIEILNLFRQYNKRASQPAARFR